MKTALGLVLHARKALSEGWGYVRGTFGMVLTERLYAEKLAQYPEDIQRFDSYIRTHWLGKRTADCVGVMKSYMWWNNGSIVYDPSTDMNADIAFANAEKRGPVAQIPEVPGVCVYRKGHIGVYDGKGFVIESKGTMHGVVRTPITGAGSNDWTHWLHYPGVDYSDWRQILNRASANPMEWQQAIDVAVAAAKADGDLGPLEILKYLPELIVKVYTEG